MRFGCWFGLLLCGLQAVSCATPVARRPRLPAASAPVEERQRAYQRFRLQESGDNWSGHEWQRADGTYEYEGILPLLDISPETRSRRSQASTRALIVLPMAAVGGALLGAGLGNQLGGNTLFSSKANTVLYATGGAFAVGSITIAIAWDPVSGMGNVYNSALATRLGLAPEVAEPPSR